MIFLAFVHKINPTPVYGKEGWNFYTISCRYKLSSVKPWLRDKPSHL